MCTYVYFCRYINRFLNIEDVEYLLSEYLYIFFFSLSGTDSFIFMLRYKLKKVR
jgi:hypothetical protein